MLRGSETGYANSAGGTVGRVVGLTPLPLKTSYLLSTRNNRLSNPLQGLKMLMIFKIKIKKCCVVTVAVNVDPPFTHQESDGAQLQPRKGNKTRRMEQRRLSLPLVGFSQDLDNRGVSGEIL